MTKQERVVAHEVATEEFDRMCEALDLEDFENNELIQDETKDTRKAIKAAIVDTIEKGWVSIGENGMPTIKLRHPVGEVTHVTFKEPIGEMFVALGDKNSRNDTTANWKVLGDLTGQPSNLYGKMRKSDLNVCQTVGLLFLV